LPASLAPTTVDYVVDLERIGPLLYEILTKVELPLAALSGKSEQGATAAQEGAASRPVEVEEYHRSLQHVLRAVQEHANIDFSHYKLPTILRRLQRRLFATNMPDLAAYAQYLDSHPNEYQQLVSSFLIKVTEFFRDPELFAALKDRVLPDLVADARKRGNVLRIWSAGCATGEEAYSLAMLVAEVLGAELDQFSVQIFATDVDEAAIEYARHAVYPAAVLEGVSPQRQAQYFHKLDGNYQVIEAIRGLVIFGLHDLGQGAPFPRIDLVLCRNVLMYFTRELQRRALQAFAFSLRNGGYLALGTAESISPAAENFTPVSPALKLYRRVGERVLYPMPTFESLQALAAGGMPPRPGVRLPSASARARATANTRASAVFGGKPPQPSEQELVLQQMRSTRERLGLVVLGLPVGVVLVDRHYDVQIINAPAMRLLDIYMEPVGEDLIHLARSVPSEALQQAIDAAFRRELWPLEPLQQPWQHSTTPAPPATPATPAEPFAAPESVVTVETLLGERRSLQFTCYPFVGSPPAAPTREDLHDLAPQQAVPAGATGGEAPAEERMTGASGDAEASASAQAQQRAGDVPLVLILVRDVTDIVRQHEQHSRAVAHLQDVSRAEQAHARSELETTNVRLQSEVARLTAEVARQSAINRSLLEGNQKLATANLTLRTTNEQLQVSEEEAEANAEEVKTLNEELQASNKELATLNEELEATLEELHASNDELQARTRALQDTAAKPGAKGRRAARQGAKPVVKG
jgi:two-component system CheB/CheR fusion protein